MQVGTVARNRKSNFCAGDMCLSMVIMSIMYVSKRLLNMYSQVSCYVVIRLQLAKERRFMGFALMQQGSILRSMAGTRAGHAARLHLHSIARAGVGRQITIGHDRIAVVACCCDGYLLLVGRDIWGPRAVCVRVCVDGTTPSYSSIRSLDAEPEQCVWKPCSIHGLLHCVERQLYRIIQHACTVGHATNHTGTQELAGA
jgi:hypothetical protein